MNELNQVVIWISLTSYLGELQMKLNYIVEFCLSVIYNWKVISIGFRFMVNDGKMKLNGAFPSSLSSEVTAGNIQNLGLIRVLDYTLNDIPLKNQKWESPITH